MSRFRVSEIHTPIILISTQTLYLSSINVSINARNSSRNSKPPNSFIFVSFFQI
ncbi:hypothetical protein HanRHA438_Chr14g0664121 [Helianthus annuus]|uniref:Uncharacterized protein n=1 Tax=Helianthus annuus TaxID=4232 RepID=A0A9K3EA65_HELAN|nr:hypothetical protein HanXRQr2_Chr14g0653401 [Helianthus annuus]KAJ0469531.1 hypothetical protein HanIR_Chr14g0708891 [Helianthus annuus]KAJ0854579.1 hypothetical protein HanRHA438_Chr14g0664121 [Helianthus annuus]